MFYYLNYSLIMTWEINLITIYFTVCRYRSELSFCSMRHTNNGKPDFTDEEVMTIYLFCTVDDLKLQTKKEIYAYADRHLRSWFPKLPKYEAFSARVNALSSSFQLLAEKLCPLVYQEKPAYEAVLGELLVDSLPIMLAKNQRAKSGKVAKEIASFGYCSTKRTYYHGLKLHAAGLMAANNSLPSLYCCAITCAGTHDETAFKELIAPNCPNVKVYADSAYMDAGAAALLLELYNITVCSIQKRVKGQPYLFYEQQCQNTAISRIRQGIESFFNWMIVHTDIQNASKCRSTKGILTHIYGKIAASVIFLLVFNP